MKYIIKEKRFYSSLVKLAIPVVTQSIISVGINIMDTIMLSKLNEDQISASSLAGTYMSIFSVFCMGLGYGASVMASQFWGDKDKQSFRSILTIVLRISFVMGILFTAVTLISPRAIMSFFTNEEPIIDAGTKYLNTVAYSFFFMLLALPSAVVLRCARKAIIPLLASLGAFLLNIFANWVFIFGNLGAPRLEIAGAALGTLISYIFQSVFLLVYLFIIDQDVGYRVRHLKLKCRQYLPRFIKYCTPVMISDSMLAIGTTLLSTIMGHIGGGFVAACAIISVITHISTTFSAGLANAATVIVGNTVGAGKKDRAMQEAVTCFCLGVVVSFFAAGAVLLIGKPYIDIYEISADTKEIAYQLLYASAWNLIFMANGSMLTKGVLRAGGDTRYLIFLDVIFLWTLSLPLGSLAGLVWSAPPFLTYLCLNIDSFVKVILGIRRLFSKKWIHVVSNHKQTEFIPE